MAVNQFIDNLANSKTLGAIINAVYYPLSRLAVLPILILSTPLASINKIQTANYPKKGAHWPSSLLMTLIVSLTFPFYCISVLSLSLPHLLKSPLDGYTSGKQLGLTKALRANSLLAPQLSPSLLTYLTLISRSISQIAAAILTPFIYVAATLIRATKLFLKDVTQLWHKTTPAAGAERTSKFSLLLSIPDSLFTHATRATFSTFFASIKGVLDGLQHGLSELHHTLRNARKGHAIEPYNRPDVTNRNYDFINNINQMLHNNKEQKIAFLTAIEHEQFKQLSQDETNEKIKTTNLTQLKKYNDLLEKYKCPVALTSLDETVIEAEEAKNTLDRAVITVEGHFPLQNDPQPDTLPKRHWTSVYTSSTLKNIIHASTDRHELAQDPATRDDLTNNEYITLHKGIVIQEVTDFVPAFVSQAHQQLRTRNAQHAAASQRGLFSQTAPPTTPVQTTHLRSLQTLTA